MVYYCDCIVTCRRVFASWSSCRPGEYGSPGKGGAFAGFRRDRTDQTGHLLIVMVLITPSKHFPGRYRS